MLWLLGCLGSFAGQKGLFFGMLLTAGCTQYPGDSSSSTVDRCRHLGAECLQICLTVFLRRSVKRNWPKGAARRTGRIPSYSYSSYFFSMLLHPSPSLSIPHLLHKCRRCGTTVAPSQGENSLCEFKPWLSESLQERVQRRHHAEKRAIQQVRRSASWMLLHTVICVHKCEMNIARNIQNCQ